LAGGLTFGIVAAGLFGVIVRPWGVKEVWPALAAAIALVLCGQLSPLAAIAGVGQGVDVYQFLAGMMLLSALAERQGVFAWAAGRVALAARGDARRLFTLLFAVAVLVTMFLSNDATAVVLTPAVAAVVAAVGIERKLPYFFTCAFVANAASFVLPISNPANLVVYGGAMPALWPWLKLFILPSGVAIGLTFVTLRLTQRADLAQPLSTDIVSEPLSASGRWTCGGLILTAIVLIAASALHLRLGPPTLGAALITSLVVLRGRWAKLAALAREVSWSTLVLVACLFVMVAALDRLGVATMLASLVQRATAWRPDVAAWAIGTGLGFGVNLVNNLPAGLLAGHALADASGMLTHASGNMMAASMVGIDLGPNLSITGSLATILWLLALREAGVTVSAWAFLRVGLIVMVPALLAAEAATVWL
jgi:arsenical pump membrane protein